ncbi:ribosomal protein S18-alanine N-acetyltransferase [Parvibium lacunae]|uniref:[Ribosomal protein bS18]-alanine N-acetyltransferase n=1 Tax=Parvibium lacunae TaxID=1888893 RepID=A0A368L7Z2_9BURK|nr:ribosomal protein S18-alanine N-acetyltransferase [Parvibium lacunae]RCS59672.1 ribosomal-protein-alanine N-acetyltransferase [Parvibium lacunae]
MRGFVNTLAATSLTARPMRVEDLESILPVEQVLYRFPWTRGNFMDSLAAGYQGWMLFKQEYLIGYAMVMISLDEYHLLNFSIVPAVHRQGYGRQFLGYLLDWAKSTQASRMLLEVRPSNLAALALYTSMGFSAVGRRKGYYPAGLDASGLAQREDAIVMAHSFC